MSWEEIFEKARIQNESILVQKVNGRGDLIGERHILDETKFRCFCGVYVSGDGNIVKVSDNPDDATCNKCIERYLEAIS